VSGHYLQAFLLFCAFVALLLIAGAVQHFTRPRATVEPEQARRTVPPTDLCMVKRCTDEGTRELNGWRMCPAHYANSSAGRAS